jgi:acyl-CoA synthetase (AMP-forming)/AMP-acid ligase II
VGAVAFVPEELADRAGSYPDRAAVRVDGGGEITFAEWDRQANAAARGLVDRYAVGKGDRVALLLPNAEAIAFHISYVAVHRAGAAAVPVNTRYARREIEHVLTDAEPQVIVTDEDHRALIDEIVSGLPTKPAVAVVGAEWAELTAGDGSPFSVGLRGDDLADVFYTSGTTGLPKGVASTHDNTAHHSIPALRGGGVFLHCIPLTSYTGLAGGLHTPLRLAVTSVAMPAFDTARMAELIEEQKANWLMMVPAQILLLLDSGALDGRDTSSVATVMFGGAPTPPAAIARLAEAFPRALLMPGYGLTEGGSSICVMPPGEALKRPGAVGKPMAGVDIRIVDDDGIEVATGEVGEITLKLPAGQRSYFRDPEATADTWRDGWVHTGDVGRIDHDGFLYVVDRKKDMIIRGGYNVYCVEVEAALYEHPDVAEVAVVGVPHAMLGQDVCAVVRLHDGAPPLTVDAARAFCEERIADYKRPRRVVVWDGPLPRNSVGKVDKKALAAGL